jgi:hypothetical protein
MGHDPFSTVDLRLTKGDSMIHLYFHPTPNPAKITLSLEEAGLPYELIPVDTSIGMGGQRKSQRH